MNKYLADKNYTIRFCLGFSSDNMEVTLERMKYLQTQRRVDFLYILNRGQAMEKRCVEMCLVTKQTYNRRRNGGIKLHRK